MKLTVIDSNAFLNIVTDKGQWLYEGKAMFIANDLLERNIKLVDIIRNEFFITTED